MNAVIRAGSPAPVLLTPDNTTGVPVGFLTGNTTVEVHDVLTSGSSNWAKLALIAGGSPLQDQAAAGVLYGYVLAENFVGHLEPPPAPKVQIGIMVVYNRDAANAAAKAGCRLFCISGNPQLASEIKDAYPDAIVVARPYLNIRGALPSFEYALNQLNGARDPRLIYVGLNESEQVGVDVDSIRIRAWFDTQMATRIKAISGATYAAGSFPTGCPDITNQAICDAIRQYYAPSFNSGLFWWDQHTYSPNMKHIYREDVQTPSWNGQRQVVVEHEWYETRWHFLYTRCGFDPQSGSRIVSCETGMHEGGIGGFTAHSATDQDVIAWAQRYQQITGLPICIGNLQYSSPFVGGTIFQIGDPAWAGYDMTRYFGALQQQVWTMPAATSKNIIEEQPRNQVVDLALKVYNLSKEVNKAANQLQQSDLQVSEPK
jgi:hypothetical protein